MKAVKVPRCIVSAPRISAGPNILRRETLRPSLGVSTAGLGAGSHTLTQRSWTPGVPIPGDEARLPASERRLFGFRAPHQAFTSWVHLLEKCVLQDGPREIPRRISIGCLVNLSQPSDPPRNRQKRKTRDGRSWHTPRSHIIPHLWALGLPFFR